MPELPEVQTVVDDLTTAGLRGLRITDIRVEWSPIIDTKVSVPSSPEEFMRQTIGRTVSSIRRRGKFIVFKFLEGGHLLVHLRMSGRLYLVNPHTAPGKHEHVRFTLSDGRELRFYEPRKFGRLYRVQQAGVVLNRLGPEPLSRQFTAEVLYQCLMAHNRLLKALLLDQHIVAGLGNIYTDEALWEAKLHPCRRSSFLSRAEAQALHRAIRKVLRSGLKHRGTSLGSGKANFHSSKHQRPGQNRRHLNVFQRTDLPCLRCKTPIQRMVVAQRGTYICPQCQDKNPC
jgi:formamidopyrimidine-DNA glycosylase